MHIDHIWAENFGAIKERVDWFPEDGINLIMGNNGSGKTTLFKAFQLLVFNYSTKKLEDYINWSVDTAKEFSVGAEFSHGGQDFRIEYYYTKKGKTGTSERQLWVGNPLPDRPNYKNSDAVEYLRGIFDPNVAREAAVVRQKDDDLINAKPAERRENLKQVWNLEYPEQIKKIEAEINHITEKLLKDAEAEIYRLENAVYAFHGLLPAPFSEDDYTKRKKDLVEVQNQIALIDANEKNKRTLIERKAKLKSSIDQSMSGIARAGEEKENTYTEIKNRQQVTRESLEEHKKKLEESLNQDFYAKVKDLEAELETLKLSRVARFDESKLMEAQDNYYETKRLYDNAVEHRDLHKQGKCPTCGNVFDAGDLSETERKVEELQEQLAKEAAEINSLSAMKAESEEKIRKLEEVKARRESLKQSIEHERYAAETKRKQIEDQIENEEQRIVDKLAENNRMIEYHQKSLDDLDARIEEIKSNISSAEKEITEIESELSMLPDMNADGLRNEATNLSSQIQEYERVQATNATYREENAKIEARKEADELALVGLKKDRDDLLEERNTLQEAKVVLQKEFPSYVISQVVGSIEVGMNDFVNLVYYKELGIKIKETKNAINVVYSPAELDVAHLSGAEDAIVSMAYKSYLNRLQGLGCIFLDEIDAHLTEENLLHLYDAIVQMNEHFEQVFLISHNEKAKSTLIAKHHAHAVEMEDGRMIA